MNRYNRGYNKDISVLGTMGAVVFFSSKYLNGIFTAYNDQCYNYFNFYINRYSLCYTLLFIKDK